MTLEITIKNVASYKSPVNIQLDNKNNFFYGLNGSGKTTISNFLQNQSNKCFKDCNIKKEKDYEFIVYNENFVGENFYESEEQKGVFTLGKLNKEAQSAINSAKGKINLLDTDKSIIKKELLNEENSMETFKNDTMGEIWKTRLKYKHTSLDYCFEGYKNNRDLFFQRALNTEVETDFNKTFQDLESEIRFLEGDTAIEKKLIQKIQLNISDIESNKIFQEVIVGSTNNPLSTLFEELNNSDWVKKGMNFINTKNKCPFCQQELQEEFIKSLKNYFDETYEKKISELNLLKNKYNSEIQKIPSINDLKKEELVDRCIGSIEMYDDLITILTQNLIKIDEKINEPSKKIELQFSQNYLDKTNNFINQINLDIEDYNDKIKNKDQVKEKIKESFWKIMRKDNDGLIKVYLKKIMKFDEKINELKNKVDIDIPNKIKQEEGIILENQKKITSIETSITRINQYLEYLALEGFKLAKYQDNFYKIMRDNSTHNQFKSLSEGEKTIISFLYFLEVSQGSVTSHGKIEKENRIIVIDDPVSSLSHTYIYSIADLIKREIINENFAHVIILTHNLYFFHEMNIRCRKICDDRNCGFYRITKNKESSAEKMNPNDIKNDYWAYWRVIKDFDEDNNKVSNSLLAISMRNIIEHYFSFVNCTTDLNDVMNYIKRINVNYQAFQRYMNRNSHSDSVNLSDFNDIDPLIFRDAFTKVFERTDNNKHYEKMIKG